MHTTIDLTDQLDLDSLKITWESKSLDHRFLRGRHGQPPKLRFGNLYIEIRQSHVDVAFLFPGGPRLTSRINLSDVPTDTETVCRRLCTGADADGYRPECVLRDPGLIHGWTDFIAIFPPSRESIHEMIGYDS
jgi:hypothetical protein